MSVRMAPRTQGFRKQIVVTLSLLTVLSIIYFHKQNITTQHENLSDKNSLSETDRVIDGNIVKALDNLLQQPEYLNKTSIQILLNFLKSHSPIERYGEKITNATAEEERCQSYGYNFDGRRQHRRRIFYASNIADDSWHTLATHAAEAHGLYHTIALVESNATLKRTPRSLRFSPDAVNMRALTSGIWGPTTNVFVDTFYDTGQFINSTGGNKDLIQEETQRDLAMGRWVKQGMTPEDLGFVGDVDEVFSRDFLLALMTCDIPQFRSGQDCKRPKVSGKTLVFETAPDCATENRVWYHPDLILGECLERIGDSSNRPKVERVNGVGLRLRGYGGQINDLGRLPSNMTLFPLFNIADVRLFPMANLVPKVRPHSAFHLHNFFDSVSTLRHKYITYGHGSYSTSTRSGDVEKTKIKPLRELGDDVDFALRCMTNQGDSDMKYRRVKGGFKSMLEAKEEPLPLAFQNKEYRKARLEEIREEFLKDEEIYGKIAQ